MEEKKEVQIVYIGAGGDPMTPAEVGERIGTALDADPKLELAFRQFLAQRLAFATSECATANLSERAAGHAGGRAAEIIVLQLELGRFLRTARGERVAKQGPNRPHVTQPQRKPRAN